MKRLVGMLLVATEVACRKKESSQGIQTKSVWRVVEFSKKCLNGTHGEGWDVECRARFRIYLRHWHQVRTCCVDLPEDAATNDNFCTPEAYLFAKCRHGCDLRLAAGIRH